MGIAAPILLELYGGVVPLPALHRTMLVASSGLDTLPHNGFVVTVLNGVSHETHKDGYMPIFALTVVTPIIATVVTIVLFTQSALSINEVSARLEHCLSRADTSFGYWIA